MESETSRLTAEIAHVLFLDMEGYSRLSLEEQVRGVRELRELVRETPEFKRSEAHEDLLRVDTGDGMALVFFGDLHSPLQCACEIALALGTPPRLPLRLGLHSGPVIRTRDINGHENVSGSGINVAQRVMDCGDAGHVLLSQSYADLVRPFKRWAGCLHDLGEVEVKHGVRLSLVSFQRGETGSAARPQRLRTLPPPELPLPNNLPFWRTDRFVGRRETLAELHRRLLSDIPTVLRGISGLGKTQMALHYAHLHLRDYPGGVFWINAADSEHLKDDYVLLGRSFFGIPEALTLESSVARLRDILSRLSQPTLFIFDNVTEATDLQLLPTSPLCRLLLTTQKNHLAPSGFGVMDLPKLDADSSLALLSGSGPELGTAEREAALEIAEAVGHLPLALALIAQHRHRLRVGFTEYRQRSLAAPAAHQPPERNLLRTLERARGKFVADTGHKGNIYETIERSFLSLNETARTALSTAGCFAAGSIGRSLLLDSLASPDEEAREECEEALADLLDSSLMSEEAPGRPEEGGSEAPEPRLRLHELVRLFARAQVSQADQPVLVARIAGILTMRLQQSNEDMDWRGIRPDMAHVSAIVAQCRSLPLPESLTRLLPAWGKYLTLHRDVAGAASHLREALALVEGLYGPQNPQSAPLLRLLGEVEQMQGDSRSALRDARSALRIAKRTFRDPDPEMVEYYVIVGFILKESGQLKRARPFYEKMWRLQVDLFGPRHHKVALCLNNLGLLCKEQGRLEEAERHLREALAIEQMQTSALGPTASMAAYWNTLGRILAESGRWPETLEAHMTALMISRHVHGSAHTMVASCLYYAALACHALHRWQEAETHYREALRIYERLLGEDNYRCGIVKERLALLMQDQANSRV